MTSLVSLLRAVAAAARRFDADEDGVSILEYTALAAFIAAIASALYAANVDQLIVDTLRSAIDNALR